MLWKIERFDAQCARGWVCLPDRTASASLVVYGGKGQPFTVECNFMRADIKKLGLHETGQCGFFIGPKVMRDLHRSPVAAVFEATSRLLLHRHSSETGFIDSRLLFLTAPAVDNAGAMAALGARHRLVYRNAETLDEETLTWLFKPNQMSSILVCAAMGQRPQAVDRSLASGQYRVVTLLTQPVAAFTRQLATLAAAAKEPDGVRFVTDPDLAELTGTLKDVDLQEAEEVGAWLARAPAPGLAKLANPMTRFYAGVTLEDEITSAHLAAALRTLGLTSVVGVTERLGEFGRTVGALVGAPDLALDEQTLDPDLQAAIEVAARTPEIAKLIAFDQTLYDLVAYALSSEEPSLEAAGRILRR
jgi:hypothetical protein